MIQYPLELSGREIGVDDEAGLLPEFLRQAPGFQLVAVFAGAAALPDDSVVNRPSGIFIPQDGRLALVGDADARHIGRRNIGGPDFHRVLLDPSLVRIMLGQLMLPDGEDILFAVK